MRDAEVRQGGLGVREAPANYGPTTTGLVPALMALALAVVVALVVVGDGSWDRDEENVNGKRKLLRIGALIL